MNEFTRPLPPPAPEAVQDRGVLTARDAAWERGKRMAEVIGPLADLPGVRHNRDDEVVRNEIVRANKNTLGIEYVVLLR
jgi:hypothetical protein